MSLERTLRTIILLLGAFLVLQGFLMHAATSGTRCDLDILLEAGKRYAAGETIYRLEDLNEHTKPPLLNPLLGLLAAIPREPVRILWDWMNLLLPFVVLGLWRGLRPWTAAAGALILLRGAWRAEMDLGQYNLVTLVLTIGAWRLARKDRWRVAGALTLMSVLLKPTQLFLVPWIVLAHQKRPTTRKLAGFATGALLLTLALVGLDATHHSPGEVIGAHLSWLDFLPRSSQKHLLRWDNWGLPSILARLGVVHLSIPFISLLGMLLAWAYHRKRPEDHSGLFHLSAWLTLALSPMSWAQNFIILLPLAFTAACRLLAGDRSAVLPALALFLPNAVKPEWLEAAIASAWVRFSAPLWLSLVAVLMMIRNSGANRGACDLEAPKK